MESSRREATLDLLRLDYEISRSVINAFTDRLFTVRNWAVTLTGAIVALSLTAEQPVVLAVGLVPPLFFAFLESIYQSWLSSAILRSEYLESQMHEVALNGGALDQSYEFGVRGWIHSPYPQFRQMILGLLRRREALTLYLGLFLVPILATFLYAQ